MARLPPNGRNRGTTPAAPRSKPSRRSTGNVTLDDVATRAGVSPITVSRALNRPELVTPATVEVVRRAVAETGYVPNLLAGGLASARTRLVAAIIPTLGNAMFIDTVQALNDTLSAAGYQLMLALSGFPAKNEDELLTTILSRRPDAVVLTGVTHTGESRRRLQAARIPVVEIWDLSETPIDLMVGFSHGDIGRAVFAHLYAKGYRRFGLIHAGDERARVRRQAFLDALAEAPDCHAASVDVPTPTTLGLGRDALRRLLAADGDLDAVFCSSDVLAHGALAEAQARNIRVPGDLAVMGFADLDFAAYSVPALSTVHIDRAAVGRLAGELLLARLKGLDLTRRTLDIGFTIIDRAST